MSDIVFEDCDIDVDGRYIYASHYTYDERERTPNIVVNLKSSVAWQS